MAKRIILAGVLGGIALFLWEAVAHMALPLGMAGVKAIANEDAVKAALKQNIREPGFYFFPAGGMAPGLTAEQQRAAEAKAEEQWRTETSGIMVVHPSGRNTSFGRMLTLQALGDIILALIAACLVAQALWLPYLGRVAFVGGLGLFPFLASEFPLWNWYGFPTDYTFAQLTVHVVGFLVAGLVIAAVVKGAATKKAAV
jgi:hypothetical protein